MRNAMPDSYDRRTTRPWTLPCVFIFDYFVCSVLRIHANCQRGRTALRCHFVPRFFVCLPIMRSPLCQPTMQAMLDRGGPFLQILQDVDSTHHLLEREVVQIVRREAALRRMRTSTCAHRGHAGVRHV